MINIDPDIVNLKLPNIDKLVLYKKAIQAVLLVYYKDTS
jgi:hypothetical protein